jgi:radical SAM superfamily enzyme YgiQ (UPF0313 family)
MRILLLTPPMTQLNTPYPATAYLTGFLRSYSYDVRQDDPAIRLVTALLSRAGLEQVARQLGGKPRKLHPAVRFFIENQAAYLATVEPAIRFLQGRDASLAMRIAGGGFLPEGPRFSQLRQMQRSGQFDPMSWAFGELGIQDRAKHLASLYVDDLADVIREGIDSRFELSRYGEKLAASAPSFEPLRQALEGEPTLVDATLDAIARELVTAHEPDVVGLTAPFPGNVYGALRIARIVRALRPGVKIVLGGGYVNTELRQLAEPRLFDYVDFVTLDDGERPLLNLLEHLAGKRGEDRLLRTFVRREGKVSFLSDPREHDVPLKDAGTPTYDGLPLASYLSLSEMLNPMHRIWSDGRWNKLTLAHGCYWRQCNFCDVGLDYIGRYEEQQADRIVDRIEALTRETGESGFHFVDEAAPPKTLLALSKRLVERGVQVSWWGNIRFEKTFTPEVTRKLAEGGCIAISGGLEVASDRLLQLMNKGVTVEQVARVTKAFTEAGILVHAYLMYGFPTQTEAETIDALERVRQLFVEGCINSAYWHRFSATVHSPIGREPEKFGIKLLPMPASTFARNDLDFSDPTPADHDMLGRGLRKALYNYMHGLGLDEDVRAWFDAPVARPRVPKRLVADALRQPQRRGRA